MAPTRVAVPVGDVEVVDRAQRQRQVVRRPSRPAGRSRGGTRRRRRSPGPRPPSARERSSSSSRRATSGARPAAVSPLLPVSWWKLLAPPRRPARARLVRAPLGIARSWSNASTIGPTTVRRAAPRAASTPPRACRPTTRGRGRRERRARGAISRPKWNATAENAAAVSARRRPATRRSRRRAARGGRVRDREQPQAGAAVAAASRPPVDRYSGNSMFDWPDATQTSPAQTSVNGSVFVACPDPDDEHVRAARRERRQRHRPASGRVGLRRRLTPGQRGRAPSRRAASAHQPQRPVALHDHVIADQRATFTSAITRAGQMNPTATTATANA